MSDEKVVFITNGLKLREWNVYDGMPPPPGGWSGPGVPIIQKSQHCKFDFIGDDQEADVLMSYIEACFTNGQNFDLYIDPELRLEYGDNISIDILDGRYVNGRVMENSNGFLKVFLSSLNAIKKV